MSSSYWNDFAPKEATRGHGNSEDLVYERLMLRFLENFARPDDVILDVGGGTGRFSLAVSLAADAGWSTLVEKMTAHRFMDAGDLRQLGHNFPSYRAFAPGEVEEELDRHGFEVVSARGLAVLCRLLRRESLATIVANETLLAHFLATEETTAAMYGRWAPSRETLFHVRRKA